MYRDPQGSEKGFSLLEFLVVMLMIGVILAVALPNLNRYYRSHQVNSAAATLQVTLQRARMSALKEKRAYRIVIHDDNATTPNRLELQQDQGGSFSTLSDETRVLSEPIRVLGASPTDSLDRVTISTRGECSAGRIYFHAEGGGLKTVKIESTCFTTVS